VNETERRNCLCFKRLGPEVARHHQLRNRPCSEFESLPPSHNALKINNLQQERVWGKSLPLTPAIWLSGFNFRSSNTRSAPGISPRLEPLIRLVSHSTLVTKRRIQVMLARLDQRRAAHRLITYRTVASISGFSACSASAQRDPAAPRVDVRPGPPSSGVVAGSLAASQSLAP
jgi:hypothetical protein